MKSAYTRPRLIVYGKLEEITQANGGDSVLDQSFPAGTSKGSLTFS